MIDDRLFERFPMDAVFGLHNLPGLPVGHLATRPCTFTAFEETFVIEVLGSGGHASAPERTTDPMIVGAEMVLALQSERHRLLVPARAGSSGATTSTRRRRPSRGADRHEVTRPPRRSRDARRS